MPFPLGKGDSMNCKKCGAELHPQANFCMNCGAMLPESAAFCFRCGADLKEKREEAGVDVEFD